MGASQLDVLLSSVADRLDVRFELDGESRDLHEFTGVVRVDGDDRAESTGEGDGPDGWPYLAWDVATLGDEVGIELHADSGAIHTHEPSYLARELAAGRYRPAVERDGVRVATVVRPDAGTEDDPSDRPPSTAGGTADRADEGDGPAAGNDGRDGTDDDGEDGAWFGAGDDDAGEHTDADIGEHAHDDADEAGDWPGPGVETGHPGGTSGGAEKDHANADGVVGSDDGGWPDASETPVDVRGSPPADQSPSAGESPAGDPVTDEDRGSSNPAGEASEEAGGDGDGSGDAAEAVDPATGGRSGELDWSGASSDYGTEGDAAGDGDPTPGVDPDPGSGPDRTDGSSDRDADWGSSSAAEAGPEATSEADSEATSEVDSEADLEPESEVDRLRRVATDRTQWGSIRQNAIRQLPDHGSEGADALAEIADAADLPAEDRELAEELLATVRQSEGTQSGEGSDPLDF